MLRKFWRPAPARLFLGSVTDASGNLVRHLEGLMGNPAVAVNQSLLDEITDLIALPAVSTVDAPLVTDYAVDVAVQSYRSGSASSVSLGPVGLPLYWRPRVRLAARLYGLQSRQTKAVVQVTQYMPWSAYFGRLLHWRVLVGHEHPARRGDLDVLLRRPPRGCSSKCVVRSDF